MITASKSDLCRWYGVTDKTLSKWVKLLYEYHDDAPFCYEFYSSCRYIPPLEVAWIVKRLGVPCLLITEHSDLSGVISSYYGIDFSD